MTTKNIIRFPYLKTTLCFLSFFSIILLIYHYIFKQPSPGPAEEFIALSASSAPEALPRDAVIERHLTKNQSPDADFSEKIIPGVAKGPELRVLALFDTYQENLASAVIYSEIHGAYRYRIGDFVYEDGILKSIYSDKITVLYQSMEFSYYIDQPHHNEAPSQDHKASLVDTDQDVDSQIPDDPYSIKRTLLARADLRPVKPGYPEGYVVGPNIPSELSHQFGVEPGDIVLTVNGYPVGEDTNDHLSWLSFQSLGTITALIRRGQEEFTLSRSAPN